MAWRGEGAEDADFVDWSGAAGRLRCLRTGEFIRLLPSSCGHLPGQCVCVCVCVCVGGCGDGGGGGVCVCGGGGGGGGGVVVVVVVVVCVCVCV